MSAAHQVRDEMTGPQLAPPWLCGFDTTGQKFLYVIGLAMDMLLEKMTESMVAKLPGFGDPSNIPLQAADRLLVQGPAETNAQFIQRLKDAFEAWSIAGSRPSVLSQIQAYLTNQQPGISAGLLAAGLPECLIVGGNTSLTTWDTTYFTDAQNAVPSHVTKSPANWDWDGQNLPSRAWLVLFMQNVYDGRGGATATVASTGGSGVSGVMTGFATITGLTGMMSTDVQKYLTIEDAASAGNVGTFQITSVLSTTSVIIANPSADSGDVNNGSLTWTTSAYPYIAPAPVWGSPSFVWGTGTWGVSCSPQVIISIRQILQRWKSAQTYYPNIIIAFGDGQTYLADGRPNSDFSPNSVEGSGNPDGTFGEYGHNASGVWIPNKHNGVNPYNAYCDGTGLAVNCYEKNVT